jgi:hypothetical protein
MDMYNTREHFAYVLATNSLKYLFQVKKTRGGGGGGGACACVLCFFVKILFKVKFV